MRERVIAVIVGWSVTALCATLGVLLTPSVLADLLGLLAMLAGLSVLLLTALVAAELLSRAVAAPTSHVNNVSADGTPTDRPNRRAA